MVDLSLTGLPLLVLFLLPGFFVFHAKQYVRPHAEYQYDNFELGLLSLGYSIVISVSLGLVFTWALAYYPNFLELPILLTDPLALFQVHPIRVQFVLFLWITSSLILAFMVGLWDPYEWLLRKFHERASVRDGDVWFGVLAPKGKDNGNEHAKYLANVRMKNGQVFSGYLDKYEIRLTDSSNRPFSLKNVVFYEEGRNTTEPCFLGEDSYVLLNTRDVDSVEVIAN